eukprot:13674975-Heterocapsa_arctica.AAC.1
MPMWSSSACGMAPPRAPAWVSGRNSGGRKVVSFGNGMGDLPVGRPGLQLMACSALDMMRLAEA